MGLQESIRKFSAFFTPAEIIDNYILPERCMPVQDLVLYRHSCSIISKPIYESFSDQSD